MTGKRQNEILGLAAAHALSDRDGKFYERLTQFPGALFDANGYIVFENEETYLACSAFQFGTKVHVLDGISNIIGYQGFTTEEYENLNAQV